MGRAKEPGARERHAFTAEFTSEAVRPADERRAARVPLTLHPSPSRHRRERMPHASAHLTLAAIGEKWKPRIYDQLRGGAVRFGRLRRAIPGVTQTMLTQHLREMVEDGLV
jgi:hypothetical protein